MVKTPRTLNELDHFAQDHYQYLIKETDIRNNLLSRRNEPEAAIFNLFEHHLEEIIVGRPGDLENLIAILEIEADAIKNSYRQATPSLTASAAGRRFNELVFSVFDYDFTSAGFTKRKNGKKAYEHVEKVGLDTCPYCNLSFTYSISKKNGKARPHLDHFFNKADYPYLAISFYNLIPSCYMCNSSLKGRKTFTTSSHLHPFLESMEGVNVFRTEISSIDFFVNKKDFDIKLQDVNGCDAPLLIKAEGNKDAFALEERYQFHKDHVGEIIKKAHVYSNKTVKRTLKVLEKQGVRVFNSEEEILNTLMGNILSPTGHHRRILSKLTTDIAEEFGIRI